MHDIQRFEQRIKDRAAQAREKALRVKNVDSLTKRNEERAFAIASSIICRFMDDNLTRVPFDHLEDLPANPGVYMAATAEGKVLYIGKANNFIGRCDLLVHHKLPTAKKRGAKYIFIATIEKDLAWYVEQVLIDKLSPPLNEHCEKWWDLPLP